jgi:hypothetical protein
MINEHVSFNQAECSYFGEFCPIIELDVEKPARGWQECPWRFDVWEALPQEASLPIPPP